MLTAWFIIDLVEVDREFRKRTAEIVEETRSIAAAQSENQLDGIRTRVDEKCDSLLEAIQTKHPLLKLGRTA